MLDLKPSIPNHLTEEGAKELAHRIRFYWAKDWRRCLHPPKVWTEFAATNSLTTKQPHCYFVVRSDMVNGLPRS